MTIFHDQGREYSRLIKSIFEQKLADVGGIQKQMQMPGAKTFIDKIFLATNLEFFSKNKLDRNSAGIDGMMTSIKSLSDINNVESCFKSVNDFLQNKEMQRSGFASDYILSKVIAAVEEKDLTELKAKLKNIIDIIVQANKGDPSSLSKNDVNRISQTIFNNLDANETFTKAFTKNSKNITLEIFEPLLKYFDDGGSEKSINLIYNFIFNTSGQTRLKLSSLEVKLILIEHIINKNLNAPKNIENFIFCGAPLGNKKEDFEKSILYRIGTTYTQDHTIIDIIKNIAENTSISGKNSPKWSGEHKDLISKILTSPITDSDSTSLFNWLLPSSENTTKFSKSFKTPKINHSKVHSSKFFFILEEFLKNEINLTKKSSSVMPLSSLSLNREVSFLFRRIDEKMFNKMMDTNIPKIVCDAIFNLKDDHYVLSFISKEYKDNNKKALMFISDKNISCHFMTTLLKKYKSNHFKEKSKFFDDMSEILLLNMDTKKAVDFVVSNDCLKNTDVGSSILSKYELEKSVSMQSIENQSKNKRISM